MFIRWALLYCGSSLALIASGQEVNRSNEIQDRAVKEFQAGSWRAAERDFRELARQDPSNVFVNMYLGQALFRQEHYVEAATWLQKARTLQKSGAPLTTTQERILTDQLVISYGMAGETKKVHVLLYEAIERDPEYPLNYYNQACAFAEEDDKVKVLLNLDLAFRHKTNVLKGEQMPDPRSDPSFKKYLHDSDFVNLIKKIGL